MLAAVPNRDVQIRYPRGKLDLFLPDAESDMTTISANLLSNPDFENGIEGWDSDSWNEAAGIGVVLETEDSKSGNSIKISADFSARQDPPLTLFEDKEYIM